MFHVHAAVVQLRYCQVRKLVGRVDERLEVLDAVSVQRAEVATIREQNDLLLAARADLAFSVPTAILSNNLQVQGLAFSSEALVPL